MDTRAFHTGVSGSPGESHQSLDADSGFLTGGADAAGPGYP